MSQPQIVLSPRRTTLLLVLILSLFRSEIMDMPFVPYNIDYVKL
ncbi:MAG: hypothetical protein NTV32_07295 [Gammaproteobacteria bacterium]|nr:hypothetical protein [Gammaproteobacteria bacterium]